MTKFISGSRVPLAFKCNGSLLNCKMPYKPQYKASTIGTAVHKALELWVIDQYVDLNKIAEEYKLDVKDIESLYYKGWAFLSDENIEIENNCAAEVSYQCNLTDDISLSGTMDLLLECNGYYHIIDWKSGEERDDEEQLKTYCLLVYLSGHLKPSYYATAVYLRHGEQVTYKYSQEDLEQHKNNIIEAFNTEPSYNPGEHCMFCEHQLSCEAKQKYAHNSVKALVQKGESELTDETLGELIPKAKEVETVLKRFWETVRERGKQTALKDGAGQLYRTMPETRNTMDKDIALSVLSNYCTPEEMKSYFSHVTKTKIKEVIKKKEMKIGSTMKQITDEIHELGGISQTTIHKFRKVKE